MNNKQNHKKNALVVAQEYRGILPLPEHLKQYNEIVPGAAERILQMAENQSKSRIQNEELLVKDAINYKKRGQYFAFILMILTFILIGFCVYFDKVWLGLFLSMSTLIAGITAFIYNNKNN
ncbi:MAG: DUF2335 domain-containing protein [Mucispirillum sp.]|nr:DUF2335 domain-containing protein [Mucispirillum sp.]